MTEQNLWQRFYRRRPGLAAVGGFCLLVLIFFAHAGGRDFYFRDAYHEYYVLSLLGSWMRAGQFALWNPHTALGAPLAGAIYPGIFYPLRILLMALPGMNAGLAVKLYLYLHFIIAGVSMLYLLRRLAVRAPGAWTGAIAYAFSGFVVSQHNAMNLVAGMALLPLVLGLMREAKKTGGLFHCGLAGLAAGLILLGGDPQGFALALALGGLFFLAPLGGRGEARGPLKTLGGLALFAVVSLASAAAEFLPSLTVLSQSARGDGFDFELASAWSFHPLRVIEFVLLRPFGDPWPEFGYWGAFLGELYAPIPLAVSPYVGVWAMVAAAFALTRRFREPAALLFGSLFLFFLLLSMGHHTPLFRFLFDHVPGVSWFRYPEKYLLVSSLCLAALCGLGTDELISRGNPAGLRPRALIFPVMVMAAGLAVWAGGHLLTNWLAPLLLPLTRQATWPVSPESAFLGLSASIARALFLIGLCLLAIKLIKAGRPGISLLPALLIFLDLFLANRFLAPTARGLYQQDSQMANTILSRERATERGTSELLADAHRLDWRYLSGYRLGSFRIARDHYLASPEGATLEAGRRWERHTLKANLGMIEGFEYFGGLNVASPSRFDWMEQELMDFFLLPVFNVKYVIGEKSKLSELPGTHLLESFEGASLLELESVFPRAYWASRCREVLSKAELARLVETNNFSQAVLIEPAAGKRIACGPDLKTVSGPGIIPAQIIEHTPNRVRLRVKAPQPGWLVLNDLFYPGWRAEVDGAPATIYRANGLVRAVKLEPGAHLVSFTYRPRGLVPGLVLSGLCFTAGSAALLVKRRKKGEAADDLPAEP